MKWWIYLFLCLVIFILPFFSSPDYSIVQHTTSQLGGQHMPNAWLMNLTFILLGVSTAFISKRLPKKFYFQQITLLLFGLSLGCTGIFSLRPIDTSLEFDAFHDQLHSIFATITGFSFVLFSFSTAFYPLLKKQRFYAVCVAVFASCISGLMFILPEYAGVLQRLMFLVTFFWLYATFPLQLDLKIRA